MAIRSINPRTGEVFGPIFPESTSKEISEAVARAQGAQKVWGTDLGLRIRALNAIADALDTDSDELVKIADLESGLGIARLTGEVARTSYQLRTFAHTLSSGKISLSKEDDAIVGAPPQGHSRFVKELIPLGVVAVFGASNFPFAFSVLGGDTASALAAGCSVIVKGHAGHPATSLRTFNLAKHALEQVGAPDHTFQIIYGFEAGKTLLESEGVAAGAFTGSKQGGMALWNMANSRPSPIPFYGELGSVNPVVALASGVEESALFAKNYLDSLLMGNGQFCTNPSILFIPEGLGIEEEVANQITERESQPFLTEATKTLHDENRELLENIFKSKVAQGINNNSQGFYSAPQVLISNVRSALTVDSVFEIECFGPTGIVLTYSHIDELLLGIECMGGALAASIFASENDQDIDSVILALKERCGRIAWNAWPTGVAVTDGQHHGGPFPATTNALSTSVGIDAIFRFMRPVALQGFPI